MIPSVNSTESVANWCNVDTKTGNITVQLEEIYCFDAEVYADEIDIPEKVDFRDDQRINLGKWVLRNLFSTFLDEEIRRDEAYRRGLRKESAPANPSLRPNAPNSIFMPDSTPGSPMISPGAMTTPRASDGQPLPPNTPGMAIGSVKTGNSPDSNDSTAPLSPRPEREDSLDKTATRQSQPPTNGLSHDYFATSAPAPESESSSENKVPTTLGDAAGTSVPTSPVEEKKKSTIFGKKFQMGFPKKLARQSVEVKAAAPTEEKSDTASNKSSDKGEKVIEDNFMGVVQKIRQEYEDYHEAKPDDPLPIGITPSLPIETPVLKPPPHTLIIIQEDNPESGGLADQYRGEIDRLGIEADTLEKIAPTWLGELLLRVSIFKMRHIPANFATEPDTVQGDSESLFRSSSMGKPAAFNSITGRQCTTQCEQDASSQENPRVCRRAHRAATRP